MHPTAPIITNTLHASPKGFLLAAAVAGFALAAASAGHAQTVIYSDPFGGANGATVQGTTPATDATGATYLGTSRGSGVPIFDTSAGNPTGSALTRYNGSDALPLATAGSFTRSAGQSFQISADLQLNATTGSGTVTDPTASTRGVGLGFYSAYVNNQAGTAGDPFPTTYTGFNLQQGGILQFVLNGVSTGRTTFALNLSQAFSSATFYNLTYTVNTGTGNLVSLFFAGQDITSNFTATTAGAFTTANTQFAGFGASSSTASAGSRVDNLTVSAVVPEPSTWAMMVGGVGLLLGAQRLRTRRA